MTKADVKDLKSRLTGKYTTYFSSKTGELSVRVWSYINNSNDVKKESEAINNFMEMVKDTPYNYEIKHRTYQGFIHDTCVIVK